MYNYSLTQCPWIKHKIVKAQYSTFLVKGWLKGFKKLGKAGRQASPRKKDWIWQGSLKHNMQVTNTEIYEKINFALMEQDSMCVGGTI